MNLPGPHRPVETLELELAEVAAIEDAADQLAGLGSDDDCVRRRDHLEARGEVRRFPDRALAHELARPVHGPDHRQAGGNADPDPRDATGETAASASPCR